MAFTQANLDALDAAIVAAATSGYAELNYGDRGMRRYTFKELLDLRTVMKQSISGTAGNAMSTLAKFDKG